jgi:hypothetical protein
MADAALANPAVSLTIAIFLTVFEHILRVSLSPSSFISTAPKRLLELSSGRRYDTGAK